MGKKEKIPPPGNKKDEYTNFNTKKKWKQLMQKPVLDCNGRNLRGPGAQIIGNALAKNKWVTQIDFSHNHFGDHGATELAQFLKLNDTLQVVNISCNEITDVGGIAIASAFIPSANPSGQPSQWNRSISYLHMGGNFLREDTLQGLCAAASCHRELVRVDLQHNEIGPLGCKGMARCMQRNNMCTFGLSNNRLGDEGAALICDAWKRHGNKGQQSVLNLSANDICKDGAAAVGELLIGNEFVEEVSLAWNSIGSKGTQLFVAKLLTSPKFILRSLNLSNNNIEDEGALEVAKLIDAGFETLVRINLASNRIRDRGGEAVFRAMSRSPVLSHLIISENELGDRSVAAITETIVVCKSLKVLDVRNCQFTEHHKNKITEAIHNRPQAPKDATKEEKEKFHFRVDMGREEVPLLLFLKSVEDFIANAPEEDEKKKSKKKGKKQKD